MIAFYRCLKSEFLKVRHMYFWLWHIVIPILPSGVFLAYSASVPRNAYGMVEAYFQVLGIGFPLRDTLYRKQHGGSWKIHIVLRMRDFWNCGERCDC